MADKSPLYERLGAKALTTPAVGGKAPTGQRSQSAKKQFDIGIYFKAVGLAFDDFFNKKLPYFFKNMGPVLKKFPDWFTQLPNDEKISYGVFVFGNVLVLAGIVLFFVL